MSRLFYLVKFVLSLELAYILHILILLRMCIKSHLRKSQPFGLLKILLLAFYRRKYEKINFGFCDFHRTLRVRIFGKVLAF